jgi:hypothetical protein
MIRRVAMIIQMTAIFRMTAVPLMVVVLKPGLVCRRPFQMETRGKAGKPLAKSCLVESRILGQRLTGRGAQQGRMEFGAIAGQAEQRPSPGGMGEKVDEGKEAKAERKASGCGQTHGAVHGAHPAACVAIGQCQVGMAAVRTIEAKGPDRAPVISDGGVSGGIPSAFEITLADGGQRLGRQINQIGDRPARTSADADGFTIAMLGLLVRAHRVKDGPARSLAPVAGMRHSVLRWSVWRSRC